MSCCSLGSFVATVRGYCDQCVITSCPFVCSPDPAPVAKLFNCNFTVTNSLRIYDWMVSLRPRGRRVLKHFQSCTQTANCHHFLSSAVHLIFQALVFFAPCTWDTISRRIGYGLILLFLEICGFLFQVGFLRFYEGSLVLNWLMEDKVPHQSHDSKQSETVFFRLCLLYLTRVKLLRAH